MICSEVNRYLDMLMDDELSDEMREELEAHAKICPQCAENIQATIEMKEMLSDIDEEADVPLAAQAAWRKAVKQEAAKIRTRRFTRMISAVAAAVVVLAGFGIAVKYADVQPKNAINNSLVTTASYDETASAGIAVIESDGADASMARMALKNADTGVNVDEFAYTVDNIDSACRYIIDLVAEYEGLVDEQRVEENCSNLYISMPAENVADFFAASSHLDVGNNAADCSRFDSNGTVTFLLALNAR